ncbi:hypothetical protein DSM112329_03598 [Paraconexibacter sp. AEG42_29]|uniref:nicotinamidase n=1 Tax=Paraconexibacter sp. AEG42_29 TaxID=2997339 RepID=A0AAU7AZ21_9ACTN
MPIQPATTALAIVDAQNGFLDGPHGELPAPGGLAAIPRIVGLAEHLIRRERDAGRGLVVAACGDEHREDCPEFTGPDAPWPRHCVAGTVGAELEERIAPLVTEDAGGRWFFGKGRTNDDIEYSMTRGHDDAGRGIVDRARAAGITAFVVTGYVTNVCVLATVLDLRAAGFEVLVYTPGVVGIPGGDGLPTPDEAIAQMAAAGADIADSVAAVA